MLCTLTLRLRLRVFLALLTGLVVCLAATPGVRRFALRIGAVDRPGESRRVHDHPIPRLGGLAIFLGFLSATLLFAQLPETVRGILLGSVIILGLGAADDLLELKPWTKLAVELAAAGEGQTLPGIACLHQKGAQ